MIFWQLQQSLQKEFIWLIGIKSEVKEISLKKIKTIA